MTFVGGAEYGRRMAQTTLAAAAAQASASVARLGSVMRGEPQPWRYESFEDRLKQWTDIWARHGRRQREHSASA